MKTYPQSEEKEFEALYRSQYSALCRYATVLLKGYSSSDLYISGRSEEAVQETFSLAWAKRKKLFSSPSPVGWLYCTLHYKTQELIREDQAWAKRLLRLSESSSAPSCKDFQLRAELRSIIPEDEYTLLKQLYLDGYTYKELSCRMGLKQSALAMRVKRIKEKLLKEFQYL